ncbi:MAG: hypothetical protein IPH22_10060 [Nitrosomonas sp.]|nr:hypothetical protein [Nitrosomonas sp.]
MTWDVDGIDDSTDTLRVYRDGALIGNSTETRKPPDISFFIMRLVGVRF